MLHGCNHMKIDIDIESQDDYLLVKYKGPDSPEISRQIMQQIVEACDKFECFKILVIAYLENSLSTFENFDLYEMFVEVGFSRKHSMAWVDQNPDTYDSTSFAETVLKNRSVAARLFREVEDAKQWLLSNTTDLA